MINILKTKQKGHPFEDLYLAMDYAMTVRRVKDNVYVKMIDGTEYEVTASLPEVLESIDWRYV